MSIVLQSSGGGSVTVQEPTTASNFIATLPAVTGTIITTGNRPAGSVLQVVNATYSTQTSSSSSTYADTGLTASITPTSSSNKILVLVDVAGIYKFSSDTGCSLKLLRNSTDLIVFAEEAGYTGSVLTNLVGTQSCNYLDSPSTTSATTYKVQFKSASNSATVRVQAISAVSTITLMEIAV
jgi:hypothetical protein